MKKGALIIGGIILVAGIGYYVVKKYFLPPTVKIKNVDWIAMTAEVSVNGTNYALTEGMGIPVDKNGRVVAFSGDKTRIVLTALGAPNAAYQIYASKT